MKLLKFLSFTVSLVALVGLNLPATPVAANQTQLAVSHGPRLHQTAGTSTNWSGYAAETSLVNPQSNAVSDVKGQWTVPAVTCTAQANYSAIWVGIDGYSNGTVEQTGTAQDCSNGQPSYYAWYEMYPKPGFRVSLPVHAGDVMSAEVNYASSKKFILTISNLTAGGSFSTTQSAPKAGRQSAEWVVEAPSSGQVLPLANFGTAYLSNSQATINGVTSTISHWPNDRIVMVNSSNQPKATPSALSPDGSSFSVGWNNN